MRVQMRARAIRAATVGVLCLAGAAQAGTVEPNARQLTQAAMKFLADHGDLCMGKYTWPRDVTAADRAAHSNDAAQLPVLERLGLVESTIIPGPTAADAIADTPPSPSTSESDLPRRYSLTAKGQRYYWRKKHTTLSVHGRPEEHDADFCVAHLTLDKVVKWTPPEPVHGQLETMVRYTYHVKPADWMTDPEARRVFPVADRIIRGQGNLLMSVTVRFGDGEWVPVLPGS